MSVSGLSISAIGAAWRNPGRLHGEGKQAEEIHDAWFPLETCVDWRSIACIDSKKSRDALRFESAQIQQNAMLSSYRLRRSQYLCFSLTMEWNVMAVKGHRTMSVWLIQILVCASMQNVQYIIPCSHFSSIATFSSSLVSFIRPPRCL